MEITEDCFTGSVFRDTLTVLGWTRLDSSRRYYAVECSVCKQDSELFGDGIFETTRESLITRGYKPCGCGQAYRWTKDQYEVRAKRKADELGYKFLGWEDEFKAGSSRIRLSCDEGEWCSRVNQFIERGYNGFNRGKTTRPDKEMIQKFFDSGVFHKDTKFTRERKYNKWYWKVDCPVCESTGYSQPQHLQRGSRCCKCGNYKQQYAYISIIKDGEIPIALKFGISRLTSLRHKYQARETPFDLELYGSWYFDNKTDCLTAEQNCRDNFLCGILPKSEFGDGYTETTSVKNLEDIIKIFEYFGGKRVYDSI